MTGFARFLFATAIPWMIASFAFARDGHRVAMVQLDADSRFGKTETNVVILERMVGEAAGAGAELIVFPEGSTHGYATDQDVWCKPQMDTYAGRRCHDVTTVAEVIPGGIIEQRLAALSRQLGVFVVYSAIERDASAYFNSAVMVGPSGYVAKYRKRALYYLDEGYATPGNSQTIVNLAFGSTGLMICADANVDTYFNDYRRHGAHVIIAIMDWDQDPSGSRSAARFFAQKASRHRLTIIAADAAPWDGTATYLGLSGPPRVREGLNEPGVGEEGIAYAEIFE